MRASGGGSKSALWRQILASVLEAELATVNTTEGAAYGAALLAGVRAGAWPHVQGARAATVGITGTQQADSLRVEHYCRGYEFYRELYPAIKPSFWKMKAQTPPILGSAEVGAEDRAALRDFIPYPPLEVELAPARS